MNLKPKNKPILTTREIVIFGLLAAMMFASKQIMSVLPNIHPLALFIVTETVVFRQKALFPIYTYILIDGLFCSFSLWWVPYLYIWTILWGITMLLPQKMSPKIAPVVYCAVCGLFGILFGTLYAPAQALIYGYNLKTTIAWIISGIPFDVTHCIGNVVMGLLVVPLVTLIKKLLENKYVHN